MPEHSLPTSLDRILRRLKSQPKQAGALAVLMTVMLVLWGKAMLPAGRTPAAAQARLVTPPALRPGGTILKGPTLSPGARALLEWRQQPMALIRRNLFVIKRDRPLGEQSSTPLASDADNEGFWEELAKSQTARADQERARRVRLENLQSQAGKLNVQSIMLRNGSPQALVNGTLVGEGDTIDGFRLVRIENQRLIVDRDGVRLEVRFNFK